MSHFYRHYFKMNRRLYKGGGEEPAYFKSATMDYGEFNKIEGKNGENLKATESYPTNGEGLLDKDVFSDLENELTNLIEKLDSMDNNLEYESDFEKGLKAALRQKFEEEIALLEHNYSAVAKEALGNSDERLTAIEANLKSEFQEFTYQLEMEIYKQAIAQKDEDASRAAKVMLINAAIGLDMGEYILETNNANVINNVFKDPLPTDPKTFNKRLEASLGENVLENAAEKMLDEIDSNQNEEQIKKNEAYFKKAIEQSIKNSGGDPELAINYEIGEDETDRLVKALAKRFKVVEKKGEKPYVIDLLPSAEQKPSGRIKVGKDKDFLIYDADAFANAKKGEGGLKDICDSQFKTTKDLKHQEKATHKRNKKDNKVERELLENIFRGRWSRLDEIRGLRPLKKRVGKNKGEFKNKTWKQVFGDTQDLKEKTNAFLNPEMEEGQDEGDEAQNNEVNEPTEATPESTANSILEGYEGSDLKQLLDLLLSLIGEAVSDETSEDQKERAEKKMGEITNAVDRDSTEIMKEMQASKAGYLSVLQKKDPQPTLKEMIEVALDVHSTAYQEGDGANLMAQFPSQRYEAIVQHMEETTGLKEEGWKIKGMTLEGELIIEKNKVELTIAIEPKKIEDQKTKKWMFKAAGSEYPILADYDPKLKQSGMGKAANEAALKSPPLLTTEETPQTP